MGKARATPTLIHDRSFSHVSRVTPATRNRRIVLGSKIRRSKDSLTGRSGCFSMSFSLISIASILFLATLLLCLLYHTERRKRHQNINKRLPGGLLPWGG